MLTIIWTTRFVAPPGVILLLVMGLIFLVGSLPLSTAWVSLLVPDNFLTRTTTTRRVYNQRHRRYPRLNSILLAKDSGSLGDAKKRNSRTESDKNNESEEESFGTFLQQMSQWPLVEALDERAGVVKQGASKKSATTLPGGRNPFLSPFATLLNFDEIITQREEKMDSKNKDVLSTWGSFFNVLKSFGANETNASAAVLEMPRIPKSTKAGVNPDASSKSSSSFDEIFRGATSSVEYMLSAASTAVSPDVFTSIIVQARNVLKFQDDLVEAATSAARDKGLDVSEAAERARDTTDYVANLVAVADQVLRNGYVSKEEDAAIGDRVDRQKRKVEATEILKDFKASLPASSANNPLFGHIPSARAVSYDEFGPAISTIAEMGWLSGGIYEQPIDRSHELGHSIVAEGISSDVYWMINDSIENLADFSEERHGKRGKDIPVRTIIIRGFDASDERVDREELFTEICNLKAQVFDSEKYPEILVHRGLFSLAAAVYSDIKKYIDWSAPAQKIIFTGHSVGGSISVLITLMLARDRGSEFVREKILRVFTFGSPPTLMLNPDIKLKKGENEECPILHIFELPTSMVFGCIQPWDPIPRLFSPIDGLYPLVDDIGDDGMTLYASGPPRSLRLVARALVEAWEGWPRFRDIVKAAGKQKYQPVGIQHIILPEPVRYLTDRFVNVNVNIPVVDEIIRLSPRELYTALESIFPLDVFELSYLTAGVRGFLHHFYPAYDSPLVLYAQKVSKEKMLETLQEERVRNLEISESSEDTTVAEGATRNSWEEAEKWMKNSFPIEPR